MASSSPVASSRIQAAVWKGRLPLEIKLASSESRTFDQSDAYLISVPRLSYLPLLLPQLHAFFSPFLIADPDAISPYDGFFTFDSVPLKWHLPIGLLYDLYGASPQDSSTSSAPHSTESPLERSLPFRLTLRFSSTSTDRPINLVQPTPIVLHDSFINSVKEADFLRSGTAKPIMSLSAADSKTLWASTQANDLSAFTKIHASLLPIPGQFRNIPLRVYLPSTSSTDDPAKAQIKVLQAHIPPFITTSLPPAANTNHVNVAAGARNPSTITTATQPPQTVGTALHSLLPSLFPSRRTPILARPILHGAQVPMGAVLEELARWASYADGWVGIVVVMNS